MSAFVTEPSFALRMVSPVGAVDDPPFRSLAECLLTPRDGEPPDTPLIMGTLDAGPLVVTAARLRYAVAELHRRLTARGLGPGHTVCLVRLPRTSETTVLVGYAALAALGVRVLLPTYTEPGVFGAWLADSRSRHLLWAADQVLRGDGPEADRRLLDRLRTTARSAGAEPLCLDADLGVRDLLLGPLPAPTSPAAPTPSGAGDPCGGTLPSGLAARMTEDHRDDECLVLTTSGSDGHATLLRYDEGALLRCCHARRLAGLHAADREGGRGLCLLVAHSMGLRAFWNAVWTREALVVLPPEWFVEHPERVGALLPEYRPTHVTGGPAVFRALLALGAAHPELTECLAGVTAVSSGAPWDADLARRLRDTFGLRLHNAFGSTETMQVTSTLVGPVDGGGPLIGRPLPGVELGLTDLPDGSAADRRARLYRLHVRSAFGSRGPLDPTDTDGAVPPVDDRWVDTGDLVEVADGGLLHRGRVDTDVVKDGFGVKISRPLVAGRLGDLGGAVRHAEVFPLRDEPGLAALFFVDGQATTDDGLVTADRPGGAALLAEVRSRLESANERLAEEAEDFEVRHAAVTRFACVAGEVPRTAKGTVSRGVLRDRHAALLARLCGPWRRAPGLVRLTPVQATPSDHVRFAEPRRGMLLRLARLDVEYRSAAGDRLTTTVDGAPREVIDLVGGFGGTLLGHRHPRVVAAAREFLDSPVPPIGDQGSSRAAEGALARTLAQFVGRSTGRSYVVRLASTGAEAVELALAHAMVEREAQLAAREAALRREFGADSPDAVRAVLRARAEVLAASRPAVLTLTGSFHGHSLGASALLGRATARGRIVAAAIDRVEIPPAATPEEVAARVAELSLDLPTLRRAPDGGAVPDRERLPRVIAAFAEPVRGEGGVAEVPLRLLRSLSGHGFPLVLDEIQCGLGRTGSPLASHGVTGDYYLFGKALGGGVAKVAALVVDRTRYRGEIEERYSSTGAGDAFSSSVALAVLDVVEEDDVAGRAAERGTRLRAVLDRVRERHPLVVRAVRGRGLMFGVEFDPAGVADRFVLRAAADRDLLGVLVCSYLLHRHGLRLLPTLSAPNTLRVEPSAYLDDPAIELLGAGLDAACAALARGDCAELLAPLVAEELAGGAPDGGTGRPRAVLTDRSAVPPSTPSPTPSSTLSPAASPLPAISPVLDPPPAGAARVAFVGHFVAPAEELAAVEPSLATWPAAARDALFARTAGLLDGAPVRAFARTLFGGRLWFLSLVVPADAATMAGASRTGERRPLVRRVQEAVDLAAASGCSVTSLGAHTSVVTRGGVELLAPPGMRLTTGNALTVAVGIRRLRDAMASAGVDPGGPGCRVAVVGATGSIGRGLVELLVAHPLGCRDLQLVGRDRARLAALAEHLAGRSDGRRPRISIATDLSAVRGARVVVLAVSSSEPLLYPRHVAPGAPLLVADLSVPTAVSPSLAGLAEVTVVPLAGTVPVPGEPGFRMAVTAPAGRAFCCAAEAMVLGLEPDRTRALSLLGPVDSQSAELLGTLAAEHGLLTGPGTGPVLIDQGTGPVLIDQGTGPVLAGSGTTRTQA